MRLQIMANTGKPEIVPALAELLPWLKERVDVAGVETDLARDLSEIAADAVLVLGGDGTLLSTARRLRGRQIPVMGVNFGRLGFLASFTPTDFKRDFEYARAAGFPTRKLLMLEASVLEAGSARVAVEDPAAVARARRFSATALNDAVVTAGSPFHMIEMEISADSERGVRYFGDGVIVATPSGSTAYNVSAGGPIVDSDVSCLCITPICAHSLSFRPVVVSADSTVVLEAVRVNEGTTLFCDGQTSTRLTAGERIVIRRDEHDALLIENPRARGWRNLAEKLNWASSPRHTAQK